MCHFKVVNKRLSKYTKWDCLHCISFHKSTSCCQAFNSGKVKVVCFFEQYKYLTWWKYGREKRGRWSEIVACGPGLCRAPLLVPSYALRRFSPGEQFPCLHRALDCTTGKDVKSGVKIDTVHTGPKRPSRQKSGVCVLIMSVDTVLIIVTQLYNQFDWSPLIISDVTNLRPLSLSLYACLYFIEWNINFTFSQDYDLQDWMIINMSHQGVYNQTLLTTFCFMIQYKLVNTNFMKYGSSINWAEGKQNKSHYH